MKQKAYIEQKAYHAGAEANKHLSHIQRISTARDLPKHTDNSPMIKVFGDPSIITNQPAPLQVHNFKTNDRKSVMFFELMTYIKSDEEIKKVSEYLSDKYKRPVFACRHDDEGAKIGNEALDSHVHLCLPWRGEDGKALRMSRTDLKADKKVCADILNAELTPHRMGQRRMKQDEYMAEQKNGGLAERKELIKNVRDNKVSFIQKTGISVSDYAELHELGKLPREHYETDKSYQEALDKGAATLDNVERESIVENTPMKKGELVGSVRKSDTDHVIDGQHGIAPPAPKEPSPEYSAQAENVAPSKSEDKPIVVALTDDDISQRKEIFGRIKKDVATMNAPFFYHAKKDGNTVPPKTWRDNILTKESSHEDMKKWIPWIARKEKEGCRVEKRVYIPALSMNPLKTAKKVMNKIDSAPPQQEQQAETVRIPFTPGR